MRTVAPIEAPAPILPHSGQDGGERTSIPADTPAVGGDFYSEETMRGSLKTWAAALGLGLVPSLAYAQNKPNYTPETLLKFQPVQPGVEFDTPATPEAIKACTVDEVKNGQGTTIGFSLRDGQGKLLRKFVNTRGNSSLDQWSYYQDGFEVYRDSDLNDDLVVDESRWLNTGGTRVAAISRNAIVGWKRISAEEASKVFVQAIVSGNLPLLETVMMTPDEIKSLGAPPAEVERIAAAATQRQTQLQALIKKLVGWDKSTLWLRFDGTMPRVIPADPAAGNKDDIVLYENAVIFGGTPNNEKNDPSKMAYLQAPELVRIGEVWKFVDLPHVIDPKQPALNAVVRNEGLRVALIKNDGSGITGPNIDNPVLTAALNKMADYDTKNMASLGGADKRKVAEFYFNRIPLLREVIAVAKTDDERLVYEKQVVDSLAAAYQTGLYTKGMTVIDQLIANGGKVAEYAAYRKVLADYAMKSEEPGVQLLEAQKKLVESLDAFVKTYPKAENVPDALLQMASINEFIAEEATARTHFTRLATDFPETNAGKKAAGAIKRMDLVGKAIDLKAADLQGQPIDAAAYRGKVLVVYFWASRAEPARRDLPELAKLYEKNKSKGLEIVGVNLDADKDELAATLKAQPLPWPQVFETGGMESRLANEFGIISLPTMLVVDGEGKVISRNLRLASELDRILEKSLGNGAAGVALGGRRD